MEATLYELKAQRQALEAQIKEKEAELAKAGEYVVIDGERIDATLNIEGELPAPKKTSYLLTYEKEAGDIVGNAGEISYEDLEANFLQSATEKVNEAVDAGNTAVQNINTAKEGALGAIGESDTAGARGSAISAIDSHVETVTKPAINDYVNNTSKPAIDTYVANTSKPSLDTYTGEKKSELDGYVTSTNKPALDAYTDTKKGEISTLTTTSLQSLQTTLADALNAIGETDNEGARKAALDAISAALTSALASIGQTDSTGARGEALTAIATALQNALASIGQSDSAGARGSAITAISQALSSALASIGQTDTEGARGAAIAAIDALYAQIQEYVASANTTIDQKVSAASTSASNAATSADTATTKASEASSSASEAAASASAASGSASAAATSASQASSKASEASTSAGAAASSASQAASSASAADSAKTAAEEARDQAQSIVGVSLTPDRVLVSNADGKFTASDISTAILSYLSGLTGNVQNQLGGKLGKNEKAQSASSADKLAVARTISISGDASGSGTFDGSANLDIELTVEGYVKESELQAMTDEEIDAAIAEAEAGVQTLDEGGADEQIS